VGSQRLVLSVHERDRVDLLVAGREVAVPEESQLLAERVGPVEDAVEPADLEQLEVGRSPRGLAQAFDRVGLVRRRRGRMKQPVDAGIRTGGQVSEQLGASRAEAGATMQVRHLAQVPGIVGRWLIASPG
jgi:hypothetical protein